MPGMNGIELAQQLIKLYPALPIILLSSVGDNSYNRYSDLFKSVLTKPIKQQILISSIHDALRKTPKPVITPAISKKQFCPGIIICKISYEYFTGRR